MDSSSTSRAPPFPQTTTPTTATWPDLPILTPADDASPPAKEHMFDKVVTPSDVGKLNRLVIPKQHAEKYFPLDSSTSDTKGLLLNFEDRHGKPWRFRYSYWNSSQSYVMTKGWSRFVKDKKLDAGDIVSFARGAAAGNKDRFYIDWRRRPDAPPPYHYHHLLHHRHPPLSLYNGGNVYPWNAPPARDWGRVVGCYNGNYNYGMVSSPNLCHHGGSVVYLGAGSAAVGPPQQQGRGAGRVASDQDQVVIGGGEVFDSVPVVQGGKAVGKRLRLFGVNMDCNEEEEEEEEDHNQRRHHVQLHDFGLDSDRGSLSDKGKSSASLDLDI